MAEGMKIYSELNGTKSSSGKLILSFWGGKKEVKHAFLGTFARLSWWKSEPFLRPERSFTPSCNYMAHEKSIKAWTMAAKRHKFNLFIAVSTTKEKTLPESFWGEVLWTFREVMCKIRKFSVSSFLLPEERKFDLKLPTISLRFIRVIESKSYDNLHKIPLHCLTISVDFFFVICWRPFSLSLNDPEWIERGWVGVPIIELIYWHSQSFPTHHQSHSWVAVELSHWRNNYSCVNHSMMEFHYSITSVSAENFFHRSASLCGMRCAFARTTMCFILATACCFVMIT